MGIGPEVACKALTGERRFGPVTLLGDWAAISQAASQSGLTVTRIASPTDTPEHGVGVFEPPSATEPVEAAAIRLAVSLLLEGQGGAMVTGPIHKARLAKRGFSFTGHTDFIADLCRLPHEPVMAFVGGQLRVALTTVHVPLLKVPALINTPRVLHTMQTADRALRDQLGMAAPRLAICGLNPHAGDDGVLGSEEILHIAPAVQLARQQGIDAVGPISSEAAFRGAMAGDFDMVIAMYHDQGLAPLKAVDFGRSVNWTLGLPIIRTSVDHGTADDIAGKGLADPRSMEAALELAERLCAARKRSP
jgi:4-hydroxythreonine-4-phosphate dehydrogenase